MLDQNTDRMWFVIGAVIVGAAIIFIANGTIPDLFATVTDNFSSVSSRGTSSISRMSDQYYVDHAIWGEDLTIIRTLDPVTGIHGWLGSHVSSSSSRVTASGGTLRLKALADIYNNSNLKSGRRYMYEVEVKNNNDIDVIVANNYGGRRRLAPGEYADIRLSNGVGSAHVQLRFETDDIEGDVDVTVGKLVFGIFNE